jgi:hypothetical protein
MEILQESSELRQLNEIFVRVENSLPENIENSMFYPKLKHLLHTEIFRFTKEHIELRDDLNFLRQNIGEQFTVDEIKEYLEMLKSKYNMVEDNVGIDYHLEVTRIDYGVPVFVIIKRDRIYVKKFVFRFRKLNTSDSVGTLSIGGVPLAEHTSLLKLWEGR